MRPFLWFSGVDRTDAALGLAGVTLATGSAVFAAQMVLSPDRKPEISGLEHFAIYARPSLSSARQESRSAPGVDYTPVGATRRGNAAPRMTDYEILEATQASALLRLPEGRITRVSTGTRLPGLGAVVSIARRNGKWMIVTRAGAIMER